MTALNNFNEQIREFYQQAVDCARQADSVFASARMRFGLLAAAMPRRTGYGLRLSF